MEVSILADSADSLSFRRSAAWKAGGRVRLGSLTSRSRDQRILEHCFAAGNVNARIILIR